MFPQIILETFSMSSNEISYFISEAVDPYFNTKNIDDVKKSRFNFESASFKNMLNWSCY